MLAQRHMLGRVATVLLLRSATASVLRRPVCGAAARLRGGSMSAGLDGATLTYFGLAGRGEAIRLAFHIGGIDFVDNRISSGWDTLKPTTPWGGLPVLKLPDGTEVGQNRAVLRLVGKQTGLYPSEDMDAAKVDELIDACDEVFSIVTNVDKENRPASAASGNIATCFSRIESFIGDEFAVGTSLTIADLAVFSTMGAAVGTIFDNMTLAMLEPYPKICALRKMVANHPQVLDWYAKQVELPYWEGSKSRYKVFLSENL